MGIQITLKSIFMIAGLIIGAVIFFKIFGFLLKIVSWFIGKLLIIAFAIIFPIFAYLSLRANGHMDAFPEVDQKIMSTLTEQYYNAIDYTEDGKLNLDHSIEYLVDASNNAINYGMEQFNNLEWE